MARLDKLMPCVAILALLHLPSLNAIHFGKDNHIVITSDSLQRKALLHLPATSSLSGKVPLVVDNHAWGSTDWLEAWMTGMSDVADREGFIVVYPQGYDIASAFSARTPLPLGVNYAFNAGGCCPEACSRKRNDVLFIRELVAYVKTVVSDESKGNITIDENRIYAMGMSNGAFFTNRLGCEARDLFAAIAPVSGMIVNGSSPRWASDPYECPTPEIPLPVLYFHGTGDIIVPYNGSKSMGFPSVEDYIALRLRLNQIDGSHKGVVSYSNRTVTCTSYGSAATNTTFCRIEGTGHSWPGCNPPRKSQPFGCNDDIHATEQIWAFFKMHARGVVTNVVI